MKYHRDLKVILSTGFLASVSTALILYINSSYLETQLLKEYVGLLFSASYVLTLIMMQFYGRLIERFDNYRVLIANLLIVFVCMQLIAWDVVPLIAFVLFTVAMNMWVINYDILLERISKNGETGRIRGVFMTLANLGYVVSPVLTGYLVSRGGYGLPYFVSSFMLLPVILLIYWRFKGTNGFRYHKHAPLKRTLKKIWHNKNMRGIFGVAFMLQVFYAWMVIYTPLHLLSIGFDWQDIGVIFTVMLLPFIIFQLPAGYLADKYIGETEMLTIGLLLMALSVFALTQVTSFFAVMMVLFCSRIGASLVEIMRDTYFYKKVDGDQLDLIEEFRQTAPVAYIIAPLIASAMLGSGLSIVHLFFVLAVTLLISLVLPLMIEDTK